MSGQRKRGFAAMNPEKQRAIASKGGQAAHSKGTAHEFSSEEARRAGHIGGRAVSMNRAHMAAIGRKGGQRSVQASAAAQARRHVSSPALPPEAKSQPLNDAQLVTEHLRADHRAINGLFHQYEFDRRALYERDPILKQICDELIQHTTLEENYVYPLLRSASADSESDQQLLDACVQAHERIKQLIQLISERSLEEDSLRMLFSELQECVRQHVQMEEEKVLSYAEKHVKPELAQLAHELFLHKREKETRTTPTTHDTPLPLASAVVEQLLDPVHEAHEAEQDVHPEEEEPPVPSNDDEPEQEETKTSKSEGEMP